TTISPKTHASRVERGSGERTREEPSRPAAAPVRSTAPTGTTQLVLVDKYRSQRPEISRNQKSAAHARRTRPPATRAWLKRRAARSVLAVRTLRIATLTRRPP